MINGERRTGNEKRDKARSRSSHSSFSVFRSPFIILPFVPPHAGARARGEKEAIKRWNKGNAASSGGGARGGLAGGLVGGRRGSVRLVDHAEGFDPVESGAPRRVGRR